MKSLQEQQKKGIKKTLIRSGILLVSMFAFAFALVPLYEVFCEVTGLNGKSSNLVEEASQNSIDEIVVDTSREVRVQFVANNNKHMPWDFAPVVDEVYLNPGKIQTFIFKAKNRTGKDMVAQAVPSVSPNVAASYLRKIECFCFDTQALRAGESVDMPVRLYVHSALPKDITTLTLAYSLFDVTPDDGVDFEELDGHYDDGHTHDDDDAHGDDGDDDDDDHEKI